MDFGQENPSVPARSNGMPARRDPGIKIRKGIAHAVLPRDHPRFVQGSPELARVWGANMDFQVIVAMRDDVGPLPMSKDLLQNLHQSDIDHAACMLPQLPGEEPLAPEALADLTRAIKAAHERKCIIWAERKYLNKAEYCERLIDYVVGYACKGEISSTDASDMFRQIIQSDRIEDETPFSKLAQKLAMKVLKSKELPRPECTFALEGFEFYHSSKTVHLSICFTSSDLSHLPLLRSLSMLTLTSEDALLTPFSTVMTSRILLD